MNVNQTAAQALRHDSPLKQQLEEKSETYRQRLSASSGVQQKINGLLRLRSQWGAQLNQPGASRQVIGEQLQTIEEEAGSYADEQSFLALKGDYSIEGARLHVSEGEEDAHTGEDNSVNVLLMPNRVLYGRDTLYR